MTTLATTRVIGETRSRATDQTRDDVWLGWVVVITTTFMHVCMAPLRRLTFDEAYYACAASRGVPWPVPQHPPMLGVLLRVTEPLGSLPVELRVRLVPIVLSAIIALGVARLAASIAAPEHRARSFLLGATFASFALVPMAGGVQAIPEMPQLAAIAWLLCIATSHVRERLSSWIAVPALTVLSACAVASKVSALVCLGAVALALLGRRAWAAAAAIALGAVIAFPFCVTSLIGQSAHAVGRGPWVSAPHVGVATSLFVGCVAMFITFGPAALTLGARSSTLSRIPGGAVIAALVTLGIVASALVSGRIPEVHWFAPASIPLYAAAASALSETPNLIRRVVASHILPTAAAVLAWCVPMGSIEKTDFFAEAPHVALSRVDAELSWTDAAQRVRNIPDYGLASWRCLYTQQCGDFERVLETRREGRP